MFKKHRYQSKGPSEPMTSHDPDFLFQTDYILTHHFQK